MKKALFVAALIGCAQLSAFAEGENDTMSIDTTISFNPDFYFDSIRNSLVYQHGAIQLGDDKIATLTVPQGFKYLDADQSFYVLTTLWGNPPSPTLGMLFPENMDPLHDDFSFAIELSYEEEGHVEDDDAADIDYDDLLEEMQESIREGNKQRMDMGYDAMELVGWAATPFYDADSKKLHWAKELRFGENEVNTLNYDIRILGRKGVLNLNAISDISQLGTVQANIPNVINSVNFNSGYAYGDFNPDIDEIAAYGIGGLIAGKVLMKVGFIGMLLKFWKIIALAIAGGFGLFKNKLAGLFGKKREE